MRDGAHVAIRVLLLFQEDGDFRAVGQFGGCKRRRVSRPSGHRGRRGSRNRQVAWRSFGLFGPSSQNELSQLLPNGARPGLGLAKDR